MVNPINGVDVNDSLFMEGREKEGRTEMKKERRDRGERKVRVGERGRWARVCVCKSV
jgi:hypothetical protein